MTLSAMAAMARAIREQLELHSTDRTLKGIPDETLRHYIEIVGAFYHDLKEEHERRQ